MIEIEKYGVIYGKDIYLFKMKNDFLDIGILNFGGILKYFNVKTPNGYKNIVFGIENIDEYLRSNNYSSAIIGRVANRIRNAQFTLGSEIYYITKNDGEHCNHGGIEGFDRKIFDYRIDGDVLILSLLSPDGDQGFGGNLALDVEFRINDNEFEIRFIAKSDKDTVFAPTYHPYFNLSDHSENIYDSLLKINSEKVAVLDENGFPTGELMSVEDTPFDFTEYKSFREGIFSDSCQIRLCNGIDHCFMRKNDYLASAYSDKSRIKLDVYSDLPGIQVYTSNDYSEKTSDNRFFKHCAFCLEPGFPADSVNIECFDKPLLLKGERAEHYIKYSVSLGE